MIDAILNNMIWGEPKLSGGKAYVQAKPTQEFWNVWRADKNIVRAAGVWIVKEGAVFLACRWIKLETVYSGNSKAIAPITKLKKKDKLLPYQVPHTINLCNSLQKYDAALDGSDTGTGKTFSAIAVCRELKLIPFVVCAKSAISVWHRAASHFGIKEITAVNYEKLRRGNTAYIKIVPVLDKKGKKTKEDFQWQIDREKCVIIFDEVHRCKAYGTLNSKMLIAAKNHGFKLLELSATVANNPLEMRATGYTIGLFPREQDFWAWAQNNGCYPGNFGGMEFSGSLQVLENIHKTIYPEKGSRMRISELGDAFPDNRIIAESYTMDSSGKIADVYREMEKQLSLLSLKKSLDSDNPLTIQLRARQQVELLKVPAMVEMAEDLLEEGNSTILFVNFTETLKALSEKLKTKCTVDGLQIGSKGASQRQKNIDDFQKNLEKIIICNIQAGGESISLHDLSGGHPRVVLINPPWSAHALIQVFGRAYRSGGKSKVIQKLIYAADTIEENMARAVRAKIDRIKMLNDGDLTRGLQLHFTGRE